MKQDSCLKNKQHIFIICPVNENGIWNVVSGCITCLWFTQVQRDLRLRNNILQRSNCQTWSEWSVHSWRFCAVWNSLRFTGTIWLVVSTPLENMLVRLDHHPNYILAKILHNVPNHQPLSSIMDIINIIAIILTIYIISPLVDQMQQALESEKKQRTFDSKWSVPSLETWMPCTSFNWSFKARQLPPYISSPQVTTWEAYQQGEKHFFVAHFHGLSFSQNVVLDKW